MKTSVNPPKKTPLNALCRELGARLVDFAGWEMPVQFSSVIAAGGDVEGALSRNADGFGAEVVHQSEMLRWCSGQVASGPACSSLKASFKVMYPF